MFLYLVTKHGLSKQSRTSPWKLLHYLKHFMLDCRENTTCDLLLSLYIPGVPEQAEQEGDPFLLWHFQLVVIVLKHQVSQSTTCCPLNVLILNLEEL